MSSEFTHFEAERGARSLLGPKGPFARKLPGWMPRESQMAMAEAVEKAFQEPGHLIVEAPTGVGKTLAYLVPAALTGLRVIVSTHTKNLQDQLLDKDLPRLAQALEEVGLSVVRSEASGQEGASTSPGALSGWVRVAVMKGRANYICLERLHRRTRQRTLPLGDTRHGLSEELSERELLDELETWARSSARGDRSELPGLPEHSTLWDSLDARSETCLGTRCPRHSECFVTRMREEGERAEIVVVNHHLLMSDLALKARAELAGDAARYGQVLPDANLLVIDEAHTLQRIASEHFGGSIGFAKIERLQRDVTAELAEGFMLRDPGTVLQSVARVTGAAAALFAELPSARRRVLLSQSDPGLAGLRAAGARAEEALQKLSQTLEEEGAGDGALGGLARRASDAASALRFVLEAEDPDYVYWSEGKGPKGKLGASPVDVARLLEKFLFARFQSVVLTSATLSVGDDQCRYFREWVGVPEGSTAIALESSFDFPRQAALVIPTDAPEPGERAAEAKMAEIAEAAIRAVGGGAMFLFTSHRAMDSMFRQLSPRLEFPSFVQGERPKRQLVEDLIARAPAVLFATQSFWEGVDVPGDALRLVLVDRLPFDVPTDPLLKAEAARIEAVGKSAFAHHQLPRAILRLRQGFGRLIRSVDDRGAVVLLDGRVNRRSYGKRFLAALPPAERLRSVNELAAWWNRPQSNLSGLDYLEPATHRKPNP